jgi:hypothetical protein
MQLSGPHVGEIADQLSEGHQSGHQRRRKQEQHRHENDLGWHGVAGADVEAHA